MAWGQGGLLFMLWIAYGVIQSRRAASVRQFAVSRSQSTRGLTAAGMLLAAVAILFGGLVAISAAGGFAKETLQPWAWPLVAVIGLVFVHLQTLAVAIMVVTVQESVTTSRTRASTIQESRHDNEEAPLP